MKQKIENMEVNIFHNVNKTASDLAQVAEIKACIINAAEALTSLRVQPRHAKSVLQNNYSDIKAEYIAVENEKLKAAETLLGGASALLDIARDKINADAENIVTEIKKHINPIHWELYHFFDYFEFVNGSFTTKKGFEKTIEVENSIILTEPADIELYEKRVMLVNLLNELKGDGSTLNVMIERIVNFNHSSGEFSMNYTIFDKNRILPAHL